MMPPPSSRRRRQRGMTLIELLLAVTLFALIVTTSGFVFRTAFNTMNRIDEKVDLDRRVIGSQRTLDQILRGIMAINAPCGGQLVGFQGSSSVLRFVTSHSLSEGSRGRPHIVELIADAKSDGAGFRLVANEYPYLGRASLTFACAQPPVVRPSSFILADQLALCRFAFKRLDVGSGMETWFPAWVFGEWPRAIRIEMQPLNPTENRVQAASLHVPVLVRNLQGL
jgi:general secretion pathway protein J